MSVQLVETQIDRVLQGTKDSSRSIRDLQHFNDVTAFELGFIESQWILASVVSETVWQHAYMMHMVLAVTNSHFRRLHKASEDDTLLSGITLDEATHWQAALKLYQQELGVVRQDPKTYHGSPDGVMTAAFLSIVFAFAMEDEVPEDILVNNDRNAIMNAINPFASTNAFLALMSILPYFQTESAWRFLLLSSDDKSKTFSSQDPGVEGLPPAFVSLFGLTNESTTDELYHRILRRLAPMLRLKPCISHMPKYFAFMGLFWLDLRPHVLMREPEALVLLAWWLAMLMPMKLWWINTRARTLINAISKYLSTFDDPLLKQLMDFPLSSGQANKDWIWEMEAAHGPFRKRATMNAADI